MPPVPSKVRVVTLYAGGPARGMLGTTPVLTWPMANPLSSEWYWIDATAWCADIDDTIGTFTASLAPGQDGNLQIQGTMIAVGAIMAGVRLTAGSPGALYAVTAILSGAEGNDVLAVEVWLPVQPPLFPIIIPGFPWSADFSNPNNSAAYYYL
jgi:hypothetical protein